MHHGASLPDNEALILTFSLDKSPKGGFILFSAGNAEGIPVAQVHLLMTQPRSGLNCHLISTYLCNPFQGCVIVGASLATGAPFGATRGYRHLALSGQNPQGNCKDT